MKSHVCRTQLYGYALSLKKENIDIKYVESCAILSNIKLMLLLG